MFELDLLDKKIINALNENVRYSYSDIAKRVRSSKEVVNYRIHRLEKEGIIKDYVTIFGFGYWAYKVLVDFSKISMEKEKEIIGFLKAHPNTNWVTPCTGGWDLIFAIMARNPDHLDKILRGILDKIGDYVQDYKIAASVGSKTFGHTYILGIIKTPREIVRNTPENLSFDEKDKKIAMMLHQNARAKLTEIYVHTGIPIDTIKYRIRKMEENCIIKRYRLILDSTILGYHRYEIFLRCVNLGDKVISKFEEYSKQNPNVEFFSRCTGAWDIEFTVHFKKSTELRNFILDVKEKFGQYIQKFDTVSLFETYNYIYFPQELR